MPEMMVNGANINYEEIGSGNAVVVLTPGGRSDMESVRGLGERLASRYRVILYDRRNCGASDVVIEGDISEHDICADDLNELLNKLDASPAYLGGGSMGCRISLLAAIRYPETVKGLLLWNVAGGSTATQRLGYNYYEQFIDIALRDGMAGIIESDFFSERIKQNPSNRDRLLSMTARQFIDVMRTWRSFFTNEDPIIGTVKEDLQSIVMPSVIVPGTDDIHPTHVAEKLHQILPNSELFPPLFSREERDTMQKEDPDGYRYAGHERAAAIYLPFLEKLEGGQ